MRAGLGIRRVGVRDSVHWWVSTSRGRRSRTLAVMLDRLVSASGIVEWRCLGRLRSLGFVQAVAGRMVEDVPRRAVEPRDGEGLTARAES